MRSTLHVCGIVESSRLTAFRFPNNLKRNVQRFCFVVVTELQDAATHAIVLQLKLETERPEVELLHVEVGR